MAAEDRPELEHLLISFHLEISGWNVSQGLIPTVNIRVALALQDPLAFGLGPFRVASRKQSLSTIFISNDNKDAAYSTLLLTEGRLRLIKLWYAFDFRFAFTYTSLRWREPLGGNHGRNTQTGVMLLILGQIQSWTFG
jgi:hypothetical protein